MLQSLRDRMTGVVAWFIVGLLTIPFAFFGIDQFAGGATDPKLVTVGDEDITLTQFRNAHAQRYQNLLQMLGDDFDPSMLDQSAFRRAVLDDMVRESAQVQYAERGGWRVTDRELASFLQTVPAFQEDGRFSPTRYRNMLARQGMTPARYEQQLREALRVEQLRSAVVETAFATPLEVEHARALEHQRRSFSFVRVPASRFLGQVEVDEASIEARYEERQEAYRVPERVRLEYIEIDAERMAEAQEAPSEAVLRELYQAEAETRFRQPERRRVRHILLTGEDAREQLEAAAKNIDDGASFDDLARELSEDPGSAGDGGSLGWIERGQMVPEFESAAFALGTDTLSEPVESEFGWHLMRVDEIDQAGTRDFDDEQVQDTLRRIYQQREIDLAFRDKVDTLEQLSFEHASSLEPAAEAIGASVQRTEWLDRGRNDGLLALPGVAQAAFGEMVRAGENSALISVAPNRVIVLREFEHEPSRVRDLSEVRERIAGELREVEAKRMARTMAESIIERVRSGDAALQAAAEEEGLEVRSVERVSRDSERADTPLIRHVFSMPRPSQVANGDDSEAESVPSLDFVDLGSSGVAVVALREVSTADGDAEDTDSVRAVRSRAAGRVANAEFAGFQQYITDAVRVRERRPLDDVDTSAQPR